MERNGIRRNSAPMVQKKFVKVIFIFLIPSFPTNCEPLELVFEFPISLRIILLTKQHMEITFKVLFDIFPHIFSGLAF